jgi:hypothetical protein
MRGKGNSPGAWHGHWLCYSSRRSAGVVSAKLESRHNRPAVGVDARESSKLPGPSITSAKMGRIAAMLACPEAGHVVTGGVVAATLLLF